MQNLNAEQIKKALECCTGDDDCNRCPYWEGADVNCFDNVKSDALALITSQEQRIKELTEENERLMRDKTALECVVSTARNQAKADTVRKMQGRLKAKLNDCCRYISGNREYFIVGEELVDQIAKEMLEGKDEIRD